mmetsp:Transcript_19250/g.43832  ORF Transcript_19250/g.43832 Transcript_19250/m.43832 type:complete len:214 (+) Transcript_19250:664-1305(+)
MALSAEGVDFQRNKKRAGLYIEGCFRADHRVEVWDFRVSSNGTSASALFTRTSEGSVSSTTPFEGRKIIVASPLACIIGTRLTGSSSMNAAMKATARGMKAAYPNTPRGPTDSIRLPEKYALASPPNAAQPQHNDCSAPESCCSSSSLFSIWSSADKSALVSDSVEDDPTTPFCVSSTTIPSATTSHTAILALDSSSATIIPQMDPERGSHPP